MCKNETKMISTIFNTIYNAIFNTKKTHVRFSQLDEEVYAMCQNLQNEINELSFFSFKNNKNIILSPEFIQLYEHANNSTIYNLCRDLNTHFIKLSHFTMQLDRIVEFEGPNLRDQCTILLLKCVASIIKLYNINNYSRKFLNGLDIKKAICFDRINKIETQFKNKNCEYTDEQKQQLLNEFNNFMNIVIE